MKAKRREVLERWFCSLWLLASACAMAALVNRYAGLGLGAWGAIACTVAVAAIAKMLTVRPRADAMERARRDVSARALNEMRRARMEELCWTQQEHCPVYHPPEPTVDYWQGAYPPRLGECVHLSEHETFHPIHRPGAAGGD